MTTTFAPDALLGLEISEILDDALRCEGVRHSEPCPEVATWLSVCPRCGHSFAWCSMHKQSWVIRTRLMRMRHPDYQLQCPVRHGGCAGFFDPDELILRPIR